VGMLLSSPGIAKETAQEIAAKHLLKSQMKVYQEAMQEDKKEETAVNIKGVTVEPVKEVTKEEQKRWKKKSFRMRKLKLVTQWNWI
ncbi:MAG: hypothetical protein HC803_06380, partial [Saprospiraceae bacterium]|nr:hypothetical protein [Saprospiraceae bacterium]